MIRAMIYKARTSEGKTLWLTEAALRDIEGSVVLEATLDIWSFNQQFGGSDAN